MSGLSELIAKDARLVILKELAGQVDGRLNEVALIHVLDAFGIKRSREWVRTQLLALAELDAVTVEEVGTVMVASLSRRGHDHVERRAVIDGVARPSD